MSLAAAAWRRSIPSRGESARASCRTCGTRRDDPRSHPRRRASCRRMRSAEARCQWYGPRVSMFAAPAPPTARRRTSRRRQARRCCACQAEARSGPSERRLVTAWVSISNVSTHMGSRMLLAVVVAGAIGVATRIPAAQTTRETFDAVYQRLQRGTTYTAQPTGVVRMSHRLANGTEYHYTLNVPDTYDPSRKYQVRIQLHGGIGGRRTNQPVGAGTVGALAGAEQIYIIPYAWDTSPWWSDDQVRNLHAIIDATKKTYNIDENRIVLSGVSDGGTGAYFVAMRDTTPYASFLPLNGYWMVLASSDIDDGMIFANNRRNKHFFIVNGGRDPLYPTRIVDPYVEHYKHGGVVLEYHPQPNAAHNTQWWPDVKNPYEAFVRAHPRNPYPNPPQSEPTSLPTTHPA